MIENILAVYNRASKAELIAGLRWYHKARLEAIALAQRYDISLESAVGAIAILSPGLRWEYNIEHAERLISAVTKHKDPPMVGVYGTRNRDNAVKVIGGASINSVISSRALKVRSFYHNILNPDKNTGYVTIDRHAQSICENTYLDTNIPSIHGAKYRRYAEAYSEAAREIGRFPHEIQAVTWIRWRNEINRSE